MVHSFPTRRSSDPAGDYLLLLDVITPGDGSLAGAGVPPGIVRVTVSESAATPPQ